MKETCDYPFNFQILFNFKKFFQQSYQLPIFTFWYFPEAISENRPFGFDIGIGIYTLPHLLLVNKTIRNCSSVLYSISLMLYTKATQCDGYCTYHLMLLSCFPQEPPRPLLALRLLRLNSSFLIFFCPHPLLKVFLSILIIRRC